MAMESTSQTDDAAIPQADREPDRLAQPVDDEQPPRLPFPVVGIGASAGGLEAFSEFLKAMRPDGGMAFILVQHLPPDRQSQMAEILARHTAMPVAQVEDGMVVEPDHVYVIRPGPRPDDPGGPAAPRAAARHAAARQPADRRLLPQPGRGAARAGRLRRDERHGLQRHRRGASGQGRRRAVYRPGPGDGAVPGHAEAPDRRWLRRLRPAPGRHPRGAAGLRGARVRPGRA